MEALRENNENIPSFQSPAGKINSDVLTNQVESLSVSNSILREEVESLTKEKEQLSSLNAELSKRSKTQLLTIASLQESQGRLMKQLEGASSSIAELEVPNFCSY
jgi:hypothetical protein